MDFSYEVTLCHARFELKVQYFLSLYDDTVCTVLY